MARTTATRFLLILVIVNKQWIEIKISILGCQRDFGDRHGGRTAMRDRIIAAHLKDFTEQFGMSDLDESEAFEQFINYCVISKHYPDSFDPEDVSVGGSGDLGLDGLGILVNDHLVFSPEGVDHFKKNLRRLDVQFVFIQSKTSPRFEASEIGTVFSGIRKFFEDSEPHEANDRIRELYRLKEHVYDSTIDMDRSPICRVYYATTGTWTDELPLRSRITQGETDLSQTGLFSSVEFIPLDSEGCKRTYRELRHKVTREIDFEKHTILPKIEGVQEAYIGIVPCREYLKLICDEEGVLNRRLFYDNVRDFQGHNPVNTEIQATLEDSARSDRFALLNNGVTVVASDVNKVGTSFRLEGYQIVNGCQTSHLLYLNREQLTPNVYMPIKLIVTADSEVTNQITQGTNRQTEVKLEAFESLAPFQKMLEELYLALGRDRDEPLYYERRSKQYDHLEIRRERIVTLATQIKCFVAMFLNEPHSTHRYYGELLDSYRNRLFSESHSPLPYYVSGATLATIERLFADGRLPRDWKPRKYHLLMVYRLQNEGMQLPPLNSKAIEKYCDTLQEKLDDETAEVAFRRAGQLVDTVQAELQRFREPHERTRVFTTALIDAASKGEGGQVATTARTTGTVQWFSDVRGYGFIDSDEGNEAFVHYTGIVGEGYRSLQKGQRVRFTNTQTQQGIQAIAVEPI